jgi:hypothetical protein
MTSRSESERGGEFHSAAVVACHTSHRKTLIDRTPTGLIGEPTKRIPIDARVGEELRDLKFR